MFSNDTRKIIFILFIAFVVISFAIATQIAKGQDEIFSLEQDTYAQALVLYNENQYESARKLSEELIKKHPNTELVQYLNALISSKLEDYDTAKSYFENALEVNPHLVENPKFMLEFGEALKAGNFLDEASIVFERCSEMEIDNEQFPGYKEMIQQHLEELKFAGGN